MRLPASVKVTNPPVASKVPLASNMPIPICILSATSLLPFTIRVSPPISRTPSISISFIVLLPFIIRVAPESTSILSISAGRIFCSQLDGSSQLPVVSNV